MNPVNVALVCTLIMTFLATVGFGLRLSGRANRNHDAVVGFKTETLQLQAAGEARLAGRLATIETTLEAIRATSDRQHNENLERFRELARADQDLERRVSLTEQQHAALTVQLSSFQAQISALQAQIAAQRVRRG